jgi:hypothetical protein
MDRYEMVLELMDQLAEKYQSQVRTIRNKLYDKDPKDKIREIIDLKSEYDHVFTHLVVIAPLLPKEGKEEKKKD